MKVQFTYGFARVAGTRTPSDPGNLVVFKLQKADTRIVVELHKYVKYYPLGNANTVELVLPPRTRREKPAVRADSAGERSTFM